MTIDNSSYLVTTGSNMHHMIVMTIDYSGYLVTTGSNRHHMIVMTIDYSSYLATTGDNRDRSRRGWWNCRSSLLNVSSFKNNFKISALNQFYILI